MRQRAFKADGDYAFGSAQPFLVNSPACVAQAVLTRLKLIAGEWFLDALAGVPYKTDILGHNTQSTRDVALRIVILATPGVIQISQYVSFVDASRNMVMMATLDTIYGAANVNFTL